ncbi:MAG: RDD family protein [Proteobacteria bacterium]|nr:RDD family protein [Pseudomonadota bacterium]MBS0464276.1 RDD family protein [Pseudomonadota bacterium]
MENPYQPPSSRVEDIRPVDAGLAGRGVRLGAVMLDGVILAALILPIEFAMGVFSQLRANVLAHRGLPIALLFELTLLGLVLFVAVQGYPLVTRGQTWGKRACGIKIVDPEGRVPSIRQLAIRYATILLPGRIPFIGPLFGITDVCLIFRDDRRCIHDLVASTRVVSA